MARRKAGKEFAGLGVLIVIGAIVSAVSKVVDSIGFTTVVVATILVILGIVWLKFAKRAKRLAYLRGKYGDESVVQHIMSKTLWQGETAEQVGISSCVRQGSIALTDRADKGASANITMKYVQAPPVSCRNHPGLCSLVLQVWDHVSRSSGNDEPIPEQGRWLGQVLRGYLAYHAVPTNTKSLCAFRHHVTDLWRRSLRRRSQRDHTTWDPAAQLVAAFLPAVRIIHPWPHDRFAVKHPRRKPGARIAPAGICAGGAQK